MGAAESWRRPGGRPIVTPRIITDDPQGLVVFVHNVFGTDGDYRPGPPVELWFGDSMVMVSGGGGEREAAPAFLHVYVDDTDATYQRALDHGATIVEPPADMPWGDRRAMVRDNWGNSWQIATARD